MNKYTSVQCHKHLSVTNNLQTFIAQYHSYYVHQECINAKTKVRAIGIGILCWHNFECNSFSFFVGK